MALQGTLDTFALPDVLRLLSTTQKTGQLLIQGDQGNGSLFLESGSVVGGETSLAVTDEPHEVLFELLRLDDGSFMFDQSATAPAAGEAVEVDAVIEAAESAHAEWQDLSTVVPSLDVAIVLAAELPDDEATITKDRWKLIVAIGSGTTVRDLGDQLGLRELPVLRATRGLVDDGLAVVDDGDIGVIDSAWADDDGDGGDTLLPSLDDDADGLDLFGDVDVDDELPEPLPEGDGSDVSAALFDVDLDSQLAALTNEHRDLVERAADASSTEEAEQILRELPDGAIDDDLMAKFLGSVRS